MTFFEYYDSIEDATKKRTFRKQIIDICFIEHSTFYTWRCRQIVPKLAQVRISEFMEKDVRELFPEK